MKNLAVRNLSDDSELLKSGLPKKKSVKKVEDESSRSVVEQVRRSFRHGNRLATFVGFVLGGFVPIASWELSHYECKNPDNVLEAIPFLMVLGGLMYSAKTVFDWGNQAFGVLKAIGFVLLIEGVMVFSSDYILNMVALGLLVFINGLGTGTNLSLQERKLLRVKD